MSVSLNPIQANFQMLANWPDLTYRPQKDDKPFVRVYLFKEVDWSYIPASSDPQDIDREAKILLAITEQELLFTAPTSQSTQSFSKEWKDGRWIPVAGLKHYCELHLGNSKSQLTEKARELISSLAQELRERGILGSRE